MTVVREPERDKREQQADDAWHKHGAQDAQHLNIAVVQSIGQQKRLKHRHISGLLAPALFARCHLVRVSAENKSATRIVCSLPKMPWGKGIEPANSDFRCSVQNAA